MKAVELLREDAPGLAHQIEAAGERGCRKLAAAVAQAAVTRTELSDPTINRAVQKLREKPAADAELQARVQAVAEMLDHEYFALKEPLEEREDAGKTDPQVMRAFSRARAASAVAGALDDDAMEAAATTAYEALAATEDSEYLADAARRALAI